MPSFIKILPENIANQIAAGEVVERPSSVVKELVENAIDAGSSEIRIEIEKGGKSLIKVSDDGIGMGRDDLVLSLLRHATSKIQSSEDIFSISTLGFRGEALPSISSVSRIALSSRRAGGIEGGRIYMEGGKSGEVESFGMPKGTVVEVRNLFYNTPARLKFLKSDETEAAHITDMIARLSISFRNVRFRLSVNGKETFKAVSSSLEERISEVLGKNIAAEMYPFSFSTDEINIYGMLSRPELNRASNSGIYSFVNSRFVKDKVLINAVMKPYRSVLEKGRYPVVVIFVEISPEKVDVNVHPAKHDVRFREPSLVHSAVSAAIFSSLSNSPWEKRRTVSEPPLFANSIQKSSTINSVNEAMQSFSGSMNINSTPEFHPSGNRINFLKQSPFSVDTVHNKTSESPPLLPEMEIIGQFKGAFILCQESDDLVIIDQHAAHERVIFEKLRKEFREGAVEIQSLLFPEMIDLTAGQTEILSNNLEFIELLGFAVENFGKNTWGIMGTPSVVASSSSRNILTDLIEGLESAGDSSEIYQRADQLLMRIACHSVVRGAHRLDEREITALINEMNKTDFAMNCPHGRPVLARITEREIGKLFNR